MSPDYCGKKQPGYIYNSFVSVAPRIVQKCKKKNLTADSGNSSTFQIPNITITFEALMKCFLDIDMELNCKSVLSVGILYNVISLF